MNSDEGSAGRGQGRRWMLNQNNISKPGSGKYIENRESGTLKGRDFVRLGQIKTMTGTLIQRGDEWEFTADGTTYEIHLGPSEYREDQGLVLKNGENAIISGFVYGIDISVTTIETEGKSLTLRDETGRPAWSGLRLGKESGTML